MAYRTKTTWLGREYGCRVYDDEVLVVEGRAARRDLIGATYRDLLRTLDKCGGDAFTGAARRRKYRAGNPVASVKHYWGGKFNAKSQATDAALSRQVACTDGLGLAPGKE